MWSRGQDVGFSTLQLPDQTNYSDYVTITITKLLNIFGDAVSFGARKVDQNTSTFRSFHHSAIPIVSVQSPPPLPYDLHFQER
ncbi:hypothetical protein BaRGS_00006883 [Batillaria attramentaria]|uniref:Uncharacterized protein n=1 Tax=Batillaria attramentaria TaxID=370345 RepID=A0ABD0LQS4_9CAEN